jgi:hypothetical protein
VSLLLLFSTPGVPVIGGNGTFVTMPGNLPDIELMWSPTTAPNATPVYADMLNRDGYLLARDIKITRGRSDEFSRFETATLTMTLDNRNRDFDPNYTGGRFYPNVKPMRRIRLRARWPKGPTGTVYTRFIGFMGDEFPQRYPAGGNDAVVPVTAYDGFGVLAMAKLPTTFTRPAETSGARVAAVLNQVGWPVADRSIMAGVASLVAYTATAGTSALAHLQDVQDAEGGSLFIDSSGNLVFQDRHYRNLSERTSRQTFATVSPGENGLHYEDLDIRWGGRMWNGAQITPSSGTVQEWNDSTSQTDYYPRVFPRSLPMSSDADALALAQYIVQFNKAPALRCYSMTLSGASDPVRLWPALLALEISNHVTVRATPPARTGTYSFEQSVEGWQETITPSSWKLTFPMSPADLNSYWTLGTSTLGVDTVLAY